MKYIFQSSTTKGQVILETVKMQNGSTSVVFQLQQNKMVTAEELTEKDFKRLAEMFQKAKDEM